MPIIINSPYSGRPVKVRDQDIGRAIRDEEGRIFYAVPRSDGNGYYTAPTRHGSAKDEERYLDMQSKSDQARQVGAERSAAQIHDATGRRRGGLRRVVILLVLLILVVGAAWAAILYFGWGEELRLYDGAPQFEVPEGPIPSPPDPLRVPETSPPEPSVGQGGPYWGEPTIRLAAAFNDVALPAPPPAARAGPAPSKAADEAQRPVEAAPPAPARDAAPHLRNDLLQVHNAPLAPTSTEAAPRPSDDAAAEMAPSAPWVTRAGGLRYQVVEPGQGRVATAGSYVLIHYETLRPDGTMIDSSRGNEADEGGETAAPLGFVLWSGQVIRGWDLGIAGMKVGETRRLIVPASLAGVQVPSSKSQVSSSRFQVSSADAGNLKPETSNLKLLFEIELIGVLPGVEQTTTRPGTPGGRAAQPGDVVEVHYTGYVEDSESPFDSSRNRPGAQPLRFRLGTGAVMTGWDLGIAGMHEDERRTLIIPPYLAYGERGVPGLIPGGATLRYEIELVRIGG